jgi:hypothetical protein
MECTCGAPTDGKWADKHSADCPALIVEDKNDIERKQALDDGQGLWDCTVCKAGSIGDPPDCPLDGVHCNFVRTEL